MCEKSHQLLAVGRCFPPGTLVSSLLLSCHRGIVGTCLSDICHPYDFIYLSTGVNNLSVPGAYPGFSQGGGGVPRSAKEANTPNKRATELKPLTCAHQGSMFRPY